MVRTPWRQFAFPLRKEPPRHPHPRHPDLWRQSVSRRECPGRSWPAPCRPAASCGKLPEPWNRCTASTPCSFPMNSFAVLHHVIFALAPPAESASPPRRTGRRWGLFLRRYAILPRHVHGIRPNKTPPVQPRSRQAQHAPPPARLRSAPVLQTAFFAFSFAIDPPPSLHYISPNMANPPPPVLAQDGGGSATFSCP